MTIRPIDSSFVLRTASASSSSGPSPRLGGISSRLGRIAHRVALALVMVGPGCAAFEPPEGEDDDGSGVIDPVAERGELEILLDDAEQYGFLEGPLWLASQQVLMFSDFKDGGKMWMFDPEDDELTLYRTSFRSNGLAEDLEGRLVACETTDNNKPGGGFLNRGAFGDTEPKVIVSAEINNPGGFLLHRPNDIIMRSDGTLYFTDSKLNQVFWIPAGSDKVELLVDGIVAANGIVLSRSERSLFVAAKEPNRIIRFPVNHDGTVGDGELFAEARVDGMTIDDAGHLYAAIRDEEGGIDVFRDPAGEGMGELLGSIEFEDNFRPTNLSFGGEDRKTLYITGPNRLMRIEMPIPGQP